MGEGGSILKELEGGKGKRERKELEGGRKREKGNRKKVTKRQKGKEINW